MVLIVATALVALRNVVLTVVEPPVVQLVSQEPYIPPPYLFITAKVAAEAPIQ